MKSQISHCDYEKLKLYLIKLFFTVLNLLSDLAAASNSITNSPGPSLLVVNNNNNFPASSLIVDSSKNYPAKYQPEFDGFKVRQYFRTNSHVKFQVRCFYYNGPCDLLSKWAKPTFPKAIFGECEKCTKMQETYMEEAFLGLEERLPEMFKTAIAAMLVHYGIEVPAKYRKRIAKAFES